MTIIDAILHVMNDAKRPLTPKEAYDLIVKKGLYSFNAQNPLGVVSGQIRRHCQGLEFPTAKNKKFFRIADDGKFVPLPRPVYSEPTQNAEHKGASETKAETDASQESLVSTFSEIRSLQEKYQNLLKERIVQELKKISPVAFEHFSKRLLHVYGFEDLCVTAVSNDGGIDGFGSLRVGLAKMRVAFQCKRWTTANIGRTEIDKFRGAIQGQFEQGIYFTTARFVRGAKEASIRPGAVPVILVDGMLLADLMIGKGFGVNIENVALYTYALDEVISPDEDT